MFLTLPKLFGNKLTLSRKILGGLALLLLFFSPSVLRAACPDLSSYYPGDDPDWMVVEQRLNSVITECLETSEFYALRGAAQLNIGKLAAALESLERALLLNPTNGAASVDYADALYQQGELFTALEINQQLFQREDIPPQLQAALEERQRRWQAETSQSETHVDLLAGYDDNLNGAPGQDRLTLTLAGQQVDLELSEELQVVPGPYANVRLGGRYRRLKAGQQHQFTGEISSRGSKDKRSDVLQLLTEYAFIKPSKNQNWQINTALSHLAFGGNALFTGTSLGFRYQPGDSGTCRPHFNVALQHQSFRQQSRLNGREARLGAGINCPVAGTDEAQGSDTTHYLGADIAALQNTALDSSRLGGDRGGWQASLSWQALQSDRSWSVQLSHAATSDASPYSSLLDNGAKRQLGRSYLLLQYQQRIRVFGDRASFLLNLYHQRRRSNIGLFRTRDSSLEFGIRLAL